ncbi:MAG TPA: LysR substrate-binding domain-containing protein [Thermohalobaculum sp.]|nr:LysR substrate-binding domain-containing protein [Thermohalobaculum sp.]
MENLRRSLPPLEPLVAFEAAARHESFTRAAAELNLTQAAVSQRIRALEQNLGKPLFARAHRQVRLTTAGRALLHAAAPALRQIAAAADELRLPAARTRLTVGADQSIAAMWLMPRLAAFRAAAGEASVRLVASDEEADGLADDVDIAILHGRGAWPGRVSVLLFAEEIYPVCAPAYLDSAPPLRQPADLPGHALLELEDVRWDWMNWRGWLSWAGVHRPAAREPLRINAYPLVIEAAKAGQGIALGWRRLVDSELASGALVRPLPQSARTEFGYHLVWPAARPLPPVAAGFRDWALAQE